MLLSCMIFVKESGGEGVLEKRWKSSELDIGDLTSTKLIIISQEIMEAKVCVIFTHQIFSLLYCMYIPCSLKFSWDEIFANLLS